MAKRSTQRSTTAKRRAAVVDLDVERQRRRREVAERRVRSVLEENRAALGRLFATGLIFTHQGSRAGRDLLLSHQALLRVADLFAQLREGGRGDDIGLKVRAEQAFATLDEQLKRSSDLTARAGEFLSGRGRE